MKKIMITIQKLDRGGAEMRLLKLINDLNLKKVNAHFYMYIMSGKEGVLTQEFLKNNNLTMVYGENGIRGLFRFYSKIKEIRPDILHLNANLAAGIYALVGKIASVKYIYSHIRTSEHYGSGFKYYLKQSIFLIMLNKYSNKVIGVCDGARKLSKTDKKKWVTIYNGVDINSINTNTTEASKGEFNLICLGRQHVAKNQVFLVDVIYSLVNLYPDIQWKLDFYGREDTSIKNEIQRRIKEKKVMPYISFCGETSNPVVTLANYNLLLLPSLREGLPGVVLEALSVGVESITSGLDGCLEIAEKISGVHIISEYDSDQWAHKIYERYMRKNFDRNEIINNLKNSCFDNEVHLREMRLLWGI